MATRSINVTKTARMVVAPRIYDSRARGNGESAELDYIEISQVWNSAAHEAFQHHLGFA